MSTPSPYNNPKAYDHLYLCGEKSPGIIDDIDGLDNPRVWEEKKAAGSSGATITFQGDGLCEFTVRLRFWTQKDFDDWEVWKRLLESPKSKSQNALDIVHPRLAQLVTPITSVVVTNVTAPKGTLLSGDIVTISFKQYRKPKPAMATPKGSNSKPGGETPEDRLDRLIETGRNQLRSHADEFTELFNRRRN